MPVDVVMPQMGESIFEGTITKWLKKPGDKIERDEPLFEISTDKVDAEIPAPAAGVLKEIKVREGQTVPIQTVVAVIDAAGPTEAPAAPMAKTTAASPSAAEPAARSAAALEQRTEPAPSIPAGEPPAPPAAAPEQRPEHVSAPVVATPAKAAGERIFSSPLVRRMARENSIDLATVRGTGAGGRISKKDIVAAVAGKGGKAAGTPPAAAAEAAGGTAHAVLENAVPRERIYFGRYEVQPMTPMRQHIAEHMVLSKRVSPHVYSIEEVDMTRIVQSSAAAKDEFEKRHGTKLTYTPFFVRACVEALRANPTINASVDGTNVVLHGEINIGIAVALDWGLIVPVLKNAEEKNFLGVQRAVNDLAERARNKKLKPEEVQENTFTITNPGIFGGLMGLGIINQPNVAILAIGAIQKRPAVIEDAIVVRSMAYVTLSYDHRVVDGATGHRFLGQVKRSLETWSEELL